MNAKTVRAAAARADSMEETSNRWAAKMPADTPRTAGIRGSLKYVGGVVGKDFSRKGAKLAKKKR